MNSDYMLLFVGMFHVDKQAFWSDWQTPTVFCCTFCFQIRRIRCENEIGRFIQTFNLFLVSFFSPRTHGHLFADRYSEIHEKNRISFIDDSTSNTRSEWIICNVIFFIETQHSTTSMESNEYTRIDGVFELCFVDFNADQTINGKFFRFY